MKNIMSFYIYALYIAIMLIWIVTFIGPPILALNNYIDLANVGYNLHTYTCHQRIDRSFCIFNDGSFGDCMTLNTIISADNPSTEKPHSVSIGTKTGYAVAVCARDTAFYIAMFLGALCLPSFRKIESKDLPQIHYFIIAIIPIAVDGICQSLGFWESTNLMRVITGSIAGFAVTFYLLPMLNRLFVKE